jgi:hypothetical protein
VIQVEIMLVAAAAATSRTCGQVIAPMLAHTLRYDAKCGTAKPKIAATRTTGPAVRKISRPNRGRDRP